MRVLITGSRGFVARHLATELVQAGHEVIKSDVEYAEDSYYCDLRDQDSLRKLIRSVQPDACVHLGGIAYVPMGWKDPELVYSVNLMGTLNLLEGFRHEWPKARVLVVSSSLIYKNAGNDEELDEDAYMYPPDIYAISKIAADLTALGYAQRYDMPIMTARPINHTGPGQSDSFVTSAFATQLKQIKSGAISPVMKVGNLDSCRDFLDVRDVARAYRLLIEKGQGGESYNIASGNLVPIRSVLEKLCDIAGVHPQIEIEPEFYRPTDSSPRMNTSKIHDVTGWHPQIPLDQTLLDLYQSIEISKTRK